MHLDQDDLEFVRFMLETCIESCDEIVVGFTQAAQVAIVRQLRGTAHTLRSNLMH